MDSSRRTLLGVLAVVLAAVGVGFAGLVKGDGEGGDSPSRRATSVCPDLLGPEVSRGEGPVVDVRARGAVGNGRVDNTEILQSLLDDAPPGATLLFREGTYLTNTLKVEARRGLRLVGEGAGSVIRRHKTDYMINFEDVADVHVEGLAFDANGIDKFGGLAFIWAKGVTITRNCFFDSRRRPVGEFDRYAIVFRNGGGANRVHEDITITNNYVNSLQIEVDNARRVRITGNRSVDAVKTAAIGAFSVGDGTVVENYVIENNTIVDPYQYGVAIVLDPPRTRNGIFRRIRIRENSITRRRTGTHDILLGTTNSNHPTSGNIFEDLEVSRNGIQVHRSLAQELRRSAIFANSSRRANFEFIGLKVNGNRFRFHGDGWRGETVIDLRRLRGSSVTDNLVVGVPNGLNVSGESNVVRGNRTRSERRASSS